MSQESFVTFLSAAGDNAALLARYNPRNLHQLLFHAKNDGYEFTAEEVAEVVAKLEANVIVEKDRTAFDGASPLWREMWGQYHLEYVVAHVLKRHSREELAALFHLEDAPV